MLVAGDVSDAEVAITRGCPSFPPNLSFEIGAGQGWNYSGNADLEVVHAPVRLPFPCEGPVLGAIPQLVLLDEVDTQNKWLI